MTPPPPLLPQCALGNIDASKTVYKCVLLFYFSKLQSGTAPLCHVEATTLHYSISPLSHETCRGTLSPSLEEVVWLCEITCIQGLTNRLSTSAHHYSWPPIHETPHPLPPPPLTSLPSYRTPPPPPLHK